MRKFPYDIILIDTETTGLRTRDGFEAIQIAAVRLDGTSLAEKAFFESLIKPKRPEKWSEASAKVHGLKLENLKDAPEAKEVADGFLKSMYAPDEQDKRAQVAMLAAHNAKFDWDFFSLLLEDAGYNGDACGYHILDTWTLAVASKGCEEITDRRGFSLQPLVEHFKIPRREKHDALDDVRATAEVLRNIRKRETEMEAAAAKQERPTGRARTAR